MWFVQEGLPELIHLLTVKGENLLILSNCTEITEHLSEGFVSTFTKTSISSDLNFRHFDTADALIHETPLIRSYDYNDYKVRNLDLPVS